MAHSKILAMKLRSLGDTVLFTAPLWELTQAFPQSEIHVAVSEQWAPLLDGFPGIARIWKFRQTQNKISRLVKSTDFAMKLRKQKFNSVINFHASPSSAKIAKLTGAKTRSIHFHGHQDANRYSTVTIPGKGILKPIIERDMDAIRALEIHIPAGRSPRVFVLPSESAEARADLQKLGLQKPVLGIALGASRPTKSWPIERFASLALDWCRKETGGVLAIAGPHEEQLVHLFLKAVDELLRVSILDQKLRAQIRSQITSQHKMPLRKTAAILSQLSVLAGNDSGPRHLALAVNTPTVTLFGPEDPFEWHPYPKEQHPFLFVEGLPCRKDADPGKPPWCGIAECVIEEHQCMKRIGVDSVLAECRRVVRKSD
jgi:ADP-heptose:LPS heptosyltransferase